MITSLTNEKVKNWAKLNNKKYRDETNSFLIEGEHLVIEAKNHGIIKEIITTEPTIDGTLVSVDVMKKITNQVSPVKVCAICEKMNKNALTNNVLVLDSVQDPGNVGALIRSAIAFGFNTIIMSNSCDVYSSKVLRATQGGIFKINIIDMDTIDAIKMLKEKNYVVYGTSLVNGVELSNVKKEPKMAIILGNEGLGVSKEALKLTDKNIFVEIKNIESLNVAIAGSIIMYKFKEVV